jgi:Protein kinase domain
VSRDAEPVLSGMSGTIGDYRLEGYIGRGRAGVVYLAKHERADHKVALKVLTPELAADAAFRTRFLRESQEAAGLGHPHVIPIYEVGDANGTVYVAMRYVQGGDARSLLNRSGPLPLAAAWTIVAQVASALDAAHVRGLVHGDVRPANMLLDASTPAAAASPRADGSDVDHVYLSDFGMSLNPPPGQAAPGQLGAPLDYAAPEQIEGRVLDGRADLYALACAGFELLCGTPPFGQDQGLTVMYAQLYASPPTATTRRPELPSAVDLVLAAALAKDPADRYATCGQFAAELRMALGLGSGGPGSPVLPSLGDNGSAAETRPGRGDGVFGWEPAPAGAAGQHDREYPPTQALPPLLSGDDWPQGSDLLPPAADWPQAADEAPPADPGWAGAEAMGGAAGPGGGGAEAMGGAADSGWGGAHAMGGAEAVGGAGGPYPRRPGRPVRLGGLGGKRLILVSAAVVIVIAVVAAGVYLSRASAPGKGGATPRASSTPSASTVASRQAAAVSNLLGSSEASRAALVAAVSEIRRCTNLSGAVGRLQRVVNQRATEYRQASALPMAALAGGATVKADLLAALRDSLQADRDYLTWARQQRNSGCAPAAGSIAYNAAISADQQAVASKQTFVQVWNPVAARYGVQQKTPGTI